MKTYKNEMEIKASRKEVWDTLINPDKVEKYMFGSRPESGWTEGEVVNFYIFPSGEKVLAVKGHISEVRMPQVLEHSLFPVQSDIPDISENYIRIRYELESTEKGTLLKITQDGFDKAANGEQRLKDAKEGWSKVLPKLKEIAENVNSKAKRDDASAEERR